MRSTKFNKNKMRKSNNRGKKNYTMYNETLYEVERVVQIKWMKNRQFCLIKWKGYDAKFNSWEPKDHITFCYNYLAPEEKDDDSEYQENLQTQPSNNHQYHTRAKIKTPMKSYAKLFQDENHEKEEKEDHTHISSEAEINPLLSLQKTIKESPQKVYDFELRQKNDPRQNVWRSSKEYLINKVLSISLTDMKEKGEQKVGKVEMQDGTIAYISQSILKTRFPGKVIEFYENQVSKKLEKSN